MIRKGLGARIHPRKRKSLSGDQYGSLIIHPMLWLHGSYWKESSLTCSICFFNYCRYKANRKQTDKETRQLETRPEALCCTWHASDFFLEGDVACVWAGVRMEPKDSLNIWRWSPVGNALRVTSTHGNRRQWNGHEVEHTTMSCWQPQRPQSQPHVMDVMDNPFPRSLGLILFIRTQDYCKALAHCRCSRKDYKLHMVQKKKTFWQICCTARNLTLEAASLRMAGTVIPPWLGDQR